MRVVIPLLLGMGLWIIASERADYLAVNAKWGESNLAAYERERDDLNATLWDVRTILLERPGRVSAGKAAGWGSTFRIGDTPVYAFLTRAHMDEVSFLYHTFSHSSDIMVLRDEDSQADANLFGIRAVVAPSTQKMPAWMRLRSMHGRFAVYEASSEGYISLTDIGANYGGSLKDALNPDGHWLTSPMIRAGYAIALEGKPTFARFDPIPKPPSLGPRGRVVSESKDGETYRAEIAALRSCYALVKITYFPGLQVTVDGWSVPIVRVFPDFCAMAMPVGKHSIEVSYRPGWLKPALFVLGFALVVGAAICQVNG